MPGRAVAIEKQITQDQAHNAGLGSFVQIYNSFPKENMVRET